MEDIQFQNMDSWKGSGSGKFGLTFKQIVLMHINRCVINGSVEWHGGYWEERTKVVGGVGMTESIYVQNTREVYNDSIIMLRALLVGYFDDKLKEADTKIQKQLTEFEKEYEEARKKQDTTLRDQLRSKSTKIYIKLFEELIMLSKRLNFFEEESTEEEM